MQEFDREPAFILKRTPYKENQYLLELYTEHFGRQRAVGRIAKQKTHRDTENLAPFRELRITGRKKTELATLFASDIVKHYPLTGQDFLSGVYLNELLLSCLEPEHTDPALFHYYREALQAPGAQALRGIEFYLVEELGLAPERREDAPFYRLYAEGEWFSLRPAKQGYEHALVQAVENGVLPAAHPHLKHYLQTLLSARQKHRLQSKKTASALGELLRR